MLEMRSVPPLTVDEEAYLVREHPTFPWKRMTKSEIEKTYPDAFKNALPDSTKLVIPRNEDGKADKVPLSDLYGMWVQAGTPLIKGLK